MWSFKGIVTNINEDLLYFQLNGNIIVHMVLLFVSDDIKKLPKLNSEITIEMPHPHFSSTSTYFQTIILCKDCKIVGNFINEPSDKSTTFLKVVKFKKFTVEDLLIIDNNLKIIEQGFKTDKFTTEELMIGLLSSVFGERKLSKFLLKTVNQLNYIDGNREQYKKFSYWTFGVHKVKEPLIGYLEFNSNYYHLFLSDFNSEIPIIITNMVNIDCIGKIVVIWNCRIITEIYNCEKFSAIQYCLADYKDVDLINLQFDNKPIMVNYNKFPYSFDFVILSKSSPFMVEDQTVKLWLFVKKSTTTETILLYLDSCYVENHVNLQIGNCYTIFYNRALRSINKPNIYAFQPRYSQYFLEKDNGIIVKCRNVSDTNSITPIITENEAFMQISSKNLITFHGRITMKKFVEPLWSKTTQYKSNDGFGTPGNKTHLIEFQCDNNQRLTVYLNNFENLSRPYGLIPNMRIIVRNVIGHNGKYYKSTPFTSFEISDYQPNIDFDTAILTNSVDWGQSSYLGLKLPNGVIVWTTIFNMFLLGLTIKNQCLDCDTIVIKSEFCRICQSARITFRTSVTLLSTDYFATSKIIAKDRIALELIKLLLGNYKEICDFIRNIGEYRYQCKKNVRSTDNILDELCDNYNSKKNIDIQVKCRKLEDTRNGEALYFLLQIRPFYKH